MALAPRAFFALAIERHVRGEDQRTGRTHTQAFQDRDALADQHLRFLEKRLERQNNPVADQTLHVRVQDAGGGSRREWSSCRR